MARILLTPGGGTIHGAIDESDPPDVEALLAMLPAGTMVREGHVFLGADGNAYWAVRAEPLHVYTSVNVATKQSARAAALAKLSAQDKAALGIDSK